MDIFETVHQDMKKLIPSSLIRDVACFVFYDYHPKDKKNIDITVCTKNGELREYFQRDLQCSLDINCEKQTPSELRILRSNNSDLFYLLATKDELFIISSKEKLQVHKKLTNIDRYDVIDTTCSGETCLKITKKDDAVPLLFNSNFECIEDCGILASPNNTEDSFPILNELQRKLVEARYSAKCNQQTYAHYVSLHQKASLLSYQNLQPTSNSSIFLDNVNNVTGALKLKSHKPWVKVCNKQIVILFYVINQARESVQKVHILIHNTIPSLVYTTKIFTSSPTPPYWQEACTTLEPEQEYVVAAIIHLEEFTQNLSSQIELSGSIAYEMSNRELLMPFEDVVISSMKLIGDQFDVLSSYKSNDFNTIIAVLAATEKTELCFRYIKQDNEQDVSIFELFCTYLQMDRVENAPNVIVYRKSPYHALNGTMLIFHEVSSKNIVPVSVHTRSASQVLTLLHCMYDAVPAKLIASTPAYKITPKTDNLSQYSEDIPNTTHKINHIDYATSMLHRSKKILEHLDSSMIKMNESKNPSVRGKVGTHIDLFAGGIDKFKEFKETMLNEAREGIDALMLLKSDENIENNLIVEEAEHCVDSLMKSDSMESIGSDVVYIG